MNFDGEKYCKDILEFVDSKSAPMERILYLFAALFVTEKSKDVVKPRLVKEIRSISKNIVGERYQKLIDSEVFENNNLLISGFIGILTKANTLDEWKEVADNYIIKMKEEQHDNELKHQAAISI